MTIKEKLRKILEARTIVICEGMTNKRTRCSRYASIGSLFCYQHGSGKNLAQQRYIAQRDLEPLLDELLGAIAFPPYAMPDQQTLEDVESWTVQPGPFAPYKLTEFTESQELRRQLHDMKGLVSRLRGRLIGMGYTDEEDIEMVYDEDTAKTVEEVMEAGLGDVVHLTSGHPPMSAAHGPTGSPLLDVSNAEAMAVGTWINDSTKYNCRKTIDGNWTISFNSVDVLLEIDNNRLWQFAEGEGYKA